MILFQIRSIIVSIVIGIALFFGIRYLVHKSQREKLAINTPQSLQIMNKLSDIVYEILNMNIEDAISPMLLNRDVYNEFTMEEGRKSFTENKKRMVLCLQHRNGTYYSDNSLVYVVLHELAHVINNELHHTKKFHLIFDTLLSRAAILNYYDYKIPFESNYCS